MLPAQFRLTPSVLIKDTIRHGRRARRGCVVAHVLTATDDSPQDPASLGPARAAFAVGRAVGNSVERHRVVRRLRAISVPLLTELPPGSQVVLRALPGAAEASNEELVQDVGAAVRKAAGSAWSPVSEPTDTHEHRTGIGEMSEDVGSPVVGDDVPGIENSAAESSTQPTQARGLLWYVGWPIRALLLGLIWVYRNTISPILPPTCRYHPSCSAYAFGALQTHGAAKGTVLASWRLLRCNPFTPGGLDPVPARGRWRPDINTDGTPRVASDTSA